MKSLSAWLLAAVMLTAASQLDFKKATTPDLSPAPPAWSESLTKQHSDSNGGLFKTIINIQEYFNKLNLMPGATLGGGVQFMYKID